MKANINPKYYPDAKITCACGNTFTTGSTLPKITVEICSACHPFFTGEMRLVDTQGRIERFQSKQKKAKSIAKTKVKARKRERPRTLREMLKKEKTPKKLSSKEKSPTKTG